MHKAWLIVAGAATFSLAWACGEAKPAKSPENENKGDDNAESESSSDSDESSSSESSPGSTAFAHKRIALRLDDGTTITGTIVSVGKGRDMVLIGDDGRQRTIPQKSIRGLTMLQTNDRVVLDDGNVVEGSVTKMIPGESVTVERSDNTARTIEWAHVRDVVTQQSGSDAPPDSIDLVDGTQLVGSITRQVQGKYVVLVTAAGERHVLAWDRVKQPDAGAPADAGPTSEFPQWRAVVVLKDKTKVEGISVRRESGDAGAFVIVEVPDAGAKTIPTDDVVKVSVTPPAPEEPAKPEKPAKPAKPGKK